MKLPTDLKQYTWNTFIIPLTTHVSLTFKILWFTEWWQLLTLIQCLQYRTTFLSKESPRNSPVTRWKWIKHRIKKIVKVSSLKTSSSSLCHSYTVLTQHFGSNFIRAYYKLQYIYKFWHQKYIFVQGSIQSALFSFR